MLHVLAPLRLSDVKLQVYFTGGGVVGRDALSVQTEINSPLVHDQANAEEISQLCLIKKKIINQIPRCIPRVIFRSNVYLNLFLFILPFLATEPLHCSSSWGLTVLLKGT